MLDKFLTRLTDMEEEFDFLKEDLKRLKAVLREKLGISLDQKYRTPMSQDHGVPAHSG